MTEPYNAGDAKAVREKAKQAKSADSDKKNVLVDLLASREGRLWMRDLLESCHIFQSSFGADALKTAFNEGERNVGLKLLSDIMQSCPDKYVEMMKEKKDG